MSPRTVFSLALAAALAGACGDAGSAAPAAAAEIHVGGLADLQREIAAHRGHPLLVNFWAMWCPPCIAELPDLAAVAKDFQKSGGAVIGVSLDLTAPGTDLADVRAKLPAFVSKRGVEFPIFVFTEIDPSALIDALGLEGPIPETIAIDARGQHVDLHVGQASRDEMEELARKARGQ